MAEKIIALVPLRGGSKSIPRKNIKPLAGRPLCDWAIRSACDSGVFDEVWVSSDDEEILEYARRAGVQAHRRSEASATDQASSESVMQDFADAHPEFDVICLIQATSPLTLPEHFQQAVALFKREQADALVTVSRKHVFIWSEDGNAVNYDPVQRPRRQDWAGELFENGAFYLTRKETFESEQCRLGGKIAVYEMPAHCAVEIDETEDWIIMETMVRRFGYRPRGTEIRLLVLDVDGVLTDGRVWYSQQGEAMKTFSLRDGHGLALVRQHGVEVGIITGEENGFVTSRAAKLGIERIAMGRREKLEVLDAWREELGLEWEQIAYMGDDLPDLPCLQAVGLSGCPRDAEPEIRRSVDCITEARGGHGAVREFVNFLLDRAGVSK